MSSITVSAIIPSYNRRQLLERAINSVLAQTHPVDEIIVVDDGSTDGTAEFIRNKYPQVNTVTCKNKGVSAARNLGTKVAASQWVAFLDSDDEWCPDKIKKQVHFIAENPNYKIVHTEESWIRYNVPVNIPNKYKKKSGNLFFSALDITAIGPSCVMIQKDFFDQLGGFDESFRVCEDYELWLRICSKELVGLVDEPLVYKYAGHTDQLSNQRELDLWRLKALIKNYKLFNEDQQYFAKVNVKARFQILKNGYIKHNKPEKLIQLENILKEFSR